MEWGPEIDASNGGVKPNWIQYEDEFMCQWNPTQGWHGPFNERHLFGGWGHDFKIKLPADHAYYKRQGKDTVTIKKITTDEAFVLFKKHSIEKDVVGVMHLLNELGIVRILGLIELFEIQHGGLDNNQRDILKAFIEWQENQQD